jgi:hypothetical protein
MAILPVEHILNLLKQLPVIPNQPQPLIAITPAHPFPATIPHHHHNQPRQPGRLGNPLGIPHHPPLHHHQIGFSLTVRRELCQ